MKKKKKKKIGGQPAIMTYETRGLKGIETNMEHQ